jgi:hypothetical protein
MSDIKKDNLDGIEEYVGSEYFDDTGKESIKSRLEKMLDSRYFVVVCVMLVAISSFLLGRISGLEDKKVPVRVINANTENIRNLDGQQKINTETARDGASVVIPVVNKENSNQNSNEVVVGSKNGTKYHYPWCSGAKQIAEKNLITFNSIEEARAKGYTPASNCKGLK